MMPRLRVIVPIAAGVAMGLVGYAGSGWAQVSPGPPAAGYYLTPSLSISETYDDNIFLTSSQRQDDFISRFEPGLKAGYQSEPLTLLGSYSFRSALYADHSSLDTALESQLASLQLKYRPIEILSFGFDGAYARTTIPSELNQPNPALPFITTTTGILTSRQTATFYTLMPSIGYSFDALTRGKATYDYLVYQSGITTTTQEVALQLDRDVTPQDTGLLKSYYHHIETEMSPAITSAPRFGTLNSYALTAGWKHRFSAQWDATAEAGPRITVGTGISGQIVDAEAAASINWRFQFGTASLGYSRTELTAAGFGGAFRSDSVFASLAVEPIRFLRLSLTPRWVRDTPEGSAAQTTGTITIYAVEAAATYQLTRWLSARFNYGYLSEDVGKLNIPHNLVTIGLDFGYPIRVY